MLDTETGEVITRRLEHEGGEAKGFYAGLEKAALKAEAAHRPEAMLLMEQRGVGPVKALAFVLTVGPVERFPTSRKLVGYLGLNPSEDSSVA
jgi:transposase